MRKSIILILMSFLLLFSACGSNEEYYTRDIYAMDTVISISIPSDTSKTEKLCNDVTYYINDLEGKLSTTKEGATAYNFNATAEEFTAEGEFLEVMKYALDVAEKTEGAYDPTCFPLTKLWKINDGGYLPSIEEVNMALANIGYTQLVMNENVISKTGAVCVDFGGIARGYALEKAVEMLKADAKYGMIAFGSSYGVWGEKADGSDWEIAITDPKNTEATLGKVVLGSEGGYLCVSGDYEHYFDKNGSRLHHVFDPKSGYPVNNGVHSVSVYSQDGAIADALSTALFVMGPDKAMTLYESGVYEFEALFVTDDGVKMTKGMEDMFVNEN